MRLGIFGGTFDPPHLGHLILAAEASAQLGLERVLWVLTPYPPHKVNQPITSLDDRLDLLIAALDDDPAFELSRVDIDRPAPHYAVDTLSLLREQYPQAMLVYLMGGDSLVDLTLWHRPGDFVHSCDEMCSAQPAIRTPSACLRESVKSRKDGGSMPTHGSFMMPVDASASASDPARARS